MEQETERKDEESEREVEHNWECSSCGETKRPHHLYECVRRMERRTTPIRSIW